MSQEKINPENNIRWITDIENETKRTRILIEYFIHHKTEEEYKEKKNAITTFIRLLSEAPSATLASEYVQDFFRVIFNKNDGKKKIWQYILGIGIFFFLACLIFNARWYDNTVVTNRYFWAERAWGIYLSNDGRSVKNWIVHLRSCGEDVCIADEGKVFRNFIEWYALY